MAEGLEETFGHGFVVATGIADVGENLGEGLLLVDLAEVEVLGQLFLFCIIGVDVAWGVVAIGFAVYESGRWQTVGEWRLFIGPAYGEGGYRHRELRQLEGVDDHLRHIDGGAEIAVAETFLVHQVAERLGIEQGIGGGIDKREEIVVAGFGLAVAGPNAGAIEVGADGQYYGGFFDHRLVEMGGRKLSFHLGIAGDDDGVELQVSHRLGAGCFGEQTTQQFLADGAVCILADGSSCQNMLHIDCFLSQSYE